MALSALHCVYTLEPCLEHQQWTRDCRTAKWRNSLWSKSRQGRFSTYMYALRSWRVTWLFEKYRWKQMEPKSQFLCGRAGATQLSVYWLDTKVLERQTHSHYFNFNYYFFLFLLSCRRLFSKHGSSEFLIGRSNGCFPGKPNPLLWICLPPRFNEKNKRKFIQPPFVYFDHILAVILWSLIFRSYKNELLNWELSSTAETKTPLLRI